MVTAFVARSSRPPASSTERTSNRFQGLTPWRPERRRGVARLPAWSLRALRTHLGVSSPTGWPESAGGVSPLHQVSALRRASTSPHASSCCDMAELAAAALVARVATCQPHSDTAATTLGPQPRHQLTFSSGLRRASAHARAGARPLAMRAVSNRWLPRTPAHPCGRLAERCGRLAERYVVPASDQGRNGARPRRADTARRSHGPPQEHLPALNAQRRCATARHPMNCHERPPIYDPRATESSPRGRRRRARATGKCARAWPSPKCWPRSRARTSTICPRPGISRCSAPTCSQALSAPGVGAGGGGESQIRSACRCGRDSEVSSDLGGLSRHECVKHVGQDYKRKLCMCLCIPEHVWAGMLICCTHFADFGQLLRNPARLATHHRDSPSSSYDVPGPVEADPGRYSKVTRKCRTSCSPHAPSWQSYPLSIPESSGIVEQLFRSSRNIAGDVGNFWLQVGRNRKKTLLPNFGQHRSNLWPMRDKFGGRMWARLSRQWLHVAQCCPISAKVVQVWRALYTNFALRRASGIQKSCDAKSQEQ